MKVRQDAWNEQDDLILAETVLNHIRTGSTQLSAFEEVAERISRSSGACGFRWNNEVRKRYKSDIKEAKAFRKRHKPAQTKELQDVTIAGVQDQSTGSDFADVIITATRNIKAQIENMSKQIKYLTKELDDANKRVELLQEELYKQYPEKTVSEDYQAFMQILERARRIGAIDRISG